MSSITDQVVVTNNSAPINTTLEGPVITTASTSINLLPPSAQLQKLHEGQDLTAVVAADTVPPYNADILPVPIVPYTTSREATSGYDETNWPSLPAASTPATKSSSVWGSRSGAELVRQSTPVGVGDRPLHPQAVGGIAPVTNFPNQHPSMKQSNIVTQFVELTAAQQTQQREFGNKNTISNIAKRVKEKTNTQIQTSTTNSGTITFLIKGKPEEVLRAKNELFFHLAAKTKTIVKIPVSVRKHILGTGGQTLRSITNRTSTRIHLPPRQGDAYDDRASEVDYDEEEHIDITIEGYQEGVNDAKAEIEKIVNENISKRVVKITDIEHHFYPLIAGAHNQRVQQLQTESGAKIHIPSYSASHDSETHEANSRENCIVVSGERDAIKKAIEMLRDRHEELRSTTSTTTTEVPKRQHKYLIGLKGASIQEILETSECSLEIPPPSDPSEIVIIRGPRNLHWKAMQAVAEKVNSIHIEILDIATYHKAENPLEHAKNVLKYLWNRSKLRKIEADMGVTITGPKGPALDKGVILEFSGKVKEDVEKARKEAGEIIKNLPPSNFTIASIEPHLHRHIIGRKGQNLQRVKETYGVEIIVPDEKDESPDILIVFEGRESDEALTDKKKEIYIKEVLEKAKQELIKAGQDASDFATQTLTIPVRFHRYIIGPKGTMLNRITGGADAPVSVKFGSSRTGAAERSANAEGKKFAPIPVSDDIVVIKGPTEEVDRVVREINKVVDDAKHIEVMNSYTIEFTFPAQYSAHVIGKGGAHVTRLKENLNVKIDIEGGAKGEEKKTHPGENVKVTIQGMRENVEEAKAKILDLVDKLQEATVLRLNVPAEYHKSLIGVGGRYVKRLEEKYGVHIRFPKNNKDPSEEGEGDADAQKPDEVIIKGGRRGVADARAEMTELLEWEKEHDNSLTFTIPAIHLPHVVGRGGSRINEIKDDTFTRIELGNPEPLPTNPGEQIVNVVIHGTKDGIAKAKEKILSFVQELESQKTITVNIDPQYHKYLIGFGGSRIREVIANAGGPDDKNAQAGVVKFPRHGPNNEEVILKGNKDLVEKVKAELLRLVENLVVGIILIPRTQHYQIIGRGGNLLRELQDRYNVEIQFPGPRSNYDTQTTSSLSEEAVKVIGTAENIEAAEAEILSKLGSRLSIPRKYHCAVAANGATIRKFQSEFSVSVNHGNENPPEPKPPKRRINGSEAEPRHTDDEQDHSVELECDIVENGDSEEEGEIPWNLWGNRKQVDLAEKYLNNLLDDARTHTHTAYITVPQDMHRHIIGRGGMTIQRIRSESKCRIDVPKGKDDEVIAVVGTEEGIEEARRLVQEVIDRAVW